MSKFWTCAESTSRHALVNREPQVNYGTEPNTHVWLVHLEKVRALVQSPCNAVRFALSVAIQVNDVAKLRKHTTRTALEEGIGREHWKVQRMRELALLAGSNGGESHSASLVEGCQQRLVHCQNLLHVLSMVMCRRPWARSRSRDEGQRDSGNADACVGASGTLQPSP